MDLLYNRRKEWPYAKNSPKDSVGRWLGTLPLRRIGHISCWDAIGDARREFTELLKGKIRIYLEQNHDMVQDSGNIIDFSLFMVGRSAARTKPTVMFVSEDKRARKQAFKMIKDSGIMKEHPGFELAHIPLTAEFENLRFLAGKDADLICDAFPKSELLDVFTLEAGKLEGRRLYFYGTSEPQTSRTATAGGVISYQGKRMVLTVDHFLEQTQTAARSIVSHLEDDDDDDDDDDDCEITGLSDIDDESDDLIDVTSRGSVTPESVASDVDGSESGGQGVSLLSSGSTLEAQEYMAAVQARLRPLDLTEERVSHSAGPNDACIRAGKVVQRSKELDYALIEVDPAVSGLYDVGDNILDLGDDSWVEKAPRDAAVKTTTPGGGTVGGILSGTPSLVRLPHSKTYTEVYIARFDQPLIEGDCGSWVRDAVTGNLFGHVFAGSPTSGLTMVMPACNVFEQVRYCLQGQLDSFEEISVAIAEGKAEKHDDEVEQRQPQSSQADFQADVLLEAPLGFHIDQWAEDDSSLSIHNFADHNIFKMLLGNMTNFPKCEARIEETGQVSTVSAQSSCTPLRGYGGLERSSGCALSGPAYSEGGTPLTREALLKHNAATKRLPETDAGMSSKDENPRAPLDLCYNGNRTPASCSSSSLKPPDPVMSLLNLSSPPRRNRSCSRSRYNDSAFYNFVERHSNRKGINGNGERVPFLVRPTLEAYWAEREIDWDLGNRIKHNEKAVLRGYETIFSILIFIGMPEFIDDFIKKGWKDDRLPLEDQHPLGPSPTFAEMVDEFREHQWRFCPLSFSQGDVMMRQNLDLRQILPIETMEILKKPTTSESITIIWKVKFYEGCTDLSPDDTVVFKEYKVQADEAHRSAWEREVSTFTAIGHDEHSVKHLGSFEQKDRCFVILEYANGGSLFGLFRRQNQLRNRAEVMFFWDALMQLLLGVNRLHNLKPSEGSVLVGCAHRDIKPDNIPVFYDIPESFSGNFKLKLTDFDTSTEPQPASPTKIGAQDSDGCRAYLAPEASHRSEEADWGDIGLNCDVWSLGCIFSNALVWVCNGMVGLKDYEDGRRAALANEPHIVGGGYETCFYDREAVLGCVLDAHENATGSLKRFDEFSPRIRNLTENDMLVPGGADGARLEAKMVWRRLKRVVSDYNTLSAIRTTNPTSPISPMSPPSNITITPSSELSTQELPNSSWAVYGENRSSPSRSSSQWTSRNGPSLIEMSPKPVESRPHNGQSQISSNHGRNERIGEEVSGSRSGSRQVQDQHCKAVSTRKSDEGGQRKHLYPVVTVDEVNEYRRRNRKQEELSCLKRLAKETDKRQFLILIDDSVSMRRYEPEVRRTVQARLTRMAKFNKSKGIKTKRLVDMICGELEDTSEATGNMDVCLDRIFTDVSQSQKVHDHTSATSMSAKTLNLGSYTAFRSFAAGATRANEAGTRAKAHLERALSEIDGLFAGLSYLDKTESPRHAESPTSAPALGKGLADDLERELDGLSTSAAHQLPQNTNGPGQDRSLEDGTVVQLLLAKDKVDVNSKDSQRRGTPLWWAAKNGNETVVHLLLAKESVDVNSKGCVEQTPLSYAAEKGHVAVVKLLLAKEGVDPDSKDDSGRTPLSWAAEKGHVAVVELLAKESVDLDSPRDRAERAGHEAVADLIVRIDMGRDYR